jgi:hypothetical protein
MAQERINFAISEFLVRWMQQQPNIQSIDHAADHTVITHTMTPGELSSFKNGIVQRLCETL